MSSKRSRLQCVALILLASAMAAGPALAEIEGTRWYRLGPAPIHGFFGGGATGRATAIAVNPYNTDQIWIGSATGGAWYSYDGGLTWGSRSCDEPVGSIALADCDETGCDTVYVGSGENGIRRDTYYGFGLLRGDLSSGAPDPVNTIPSCTPFPKWELLAGDPYEFHHGSINDIVVIEPADPEGDDTLLVTLSTGKTTSASQATNTAPEPSGGYGIYRSVDAGDTWDKLDVLPGPEEARPSDLEIDPSDSGVLYAGLIGKGVFKSVDGGITWCPLNDGITLPPDCPDAVNLPDVTTYTFDHVEIALFPGDSDILYASFGRCADPLIQNCAPSIYYSEDGGLNWAETRPGSDAHNNNYNLPGRAFSRYTHALVVHPEEPDTIFFGGIKLWKSTDKGAGFVAADFNADPFCSGYGCILHYDYRDIVIHPADANLMYATNDGGFAYSTDGGETWTAENDSLPITGFYSIASSPLTPRVIGGSQDNAGQIWDGHVAWDHMSCCGDGGFSVMDLDDQQIMYVVSNHGKVQRSTSGGSSWLLREIPGGEEYQRLFSAPLVQDPTLDVESDNHPLYFGGDRLWRSVNDADFWSEASPVLADGACPEIVTSPTKDGHFDFGGRNVITAIAVAPSNPGRIYVGYYGGEIFVTDSPSVDPSDWSDDLSEGLPLAPVTRIAVHPGGPDTAFVAFSGFGTSARVWKTVDGGENWSPSASGLPEGVPVNTISIEPSTPDNLWAGLDGNLTGESLYKSEDGGASWDPWNELGWLPNAPVYEISIDEEHERIYAATHGRGAYVLGVPFLTTTSDCGSDEQIDNLVVTGQNLLQNQHECMMMLYQTRSTDSAQALCSDSEDPDKWAIDDRDATNNEVRTTSLGELVAGYTALAYACYEEVCVNGIPIAECNDDVDGDSIPDPLTTVVVACPFTQEASGAVEACVQSSSCLPSAHLWVGLSRYVPSPGGDAFSLTPSVQSRNGARSLCTVSVSYGPGETPADVLMRARDAVDASRTCTENLADAELAGIPGDGEDEFPRDPALTIETGGTRGIDTVPAVHAAPGTGVGTCYELDKLGVPVSGQLQAMRLEFETLVSGAAGGSIDIGERSGLGRCFITVDTLPGQTAAEIARAVESAFQDPAVPSLHPHCPVDRNPRDVIADGDSVILIVAKAIQLCIDDAGVGFKLRPRGIDNVHPAADAGGDQTVECTSPHGARVTLDGSGSSDPDSTPGTGDDIASYEWFEDYGEPGQTSLGTGEVLSLTFGIGSHDVTLGVTDLEGLVSLDDVRISVVDTTSPEISASAAPDTLWPPNHRMVDVEATVIADDICSTPAVVLASAASDEPDNAPGNGDGDTVHDIQDAETGTADFLLKLRAERDGAGDGRTYTLTYTATDGSGNESSTGALVDVPHSQGGVTEPVMLTVEESDRGTVVRWGPVAGAVEYNVIRGNRESIRETSSSFDVGNVLCIEAGSTDENTEGNEDPVIPLPGAAFFYLVEYDDGARSSYGTESAAKPRVTGSGDCP